MSPLSNNALFLTYDKNPFASFFRKGLNVSLSTDDPLQFAFTKEPLIEEYAVAAQIYKLGPVDMCELAKHSVDQSGFELVLKRRWLGEDCHLPGVAGNNVAKSNVPNIREAFRHETLIGEICLIERYTSLPPNPNSASPLGETSSSGATEHRFGENEVSHDKGSVAYHHNLSSYWSQQPPISHLHLLDTKPSQEIQSSGPLPYSSNLNSSASLSSLQMPEQKIIPGLVHERVRRGSSLNSSTTGPQATENGVE